MLHLEKKLSFAVVALLIMSGCVGKSEYLKKQAEADDLKMDIATVTEKNRQLQLEVENLIKEKAALLDAEKSLQAKHEKLATDRKNLETSSEAFKKEVTITIERLREQNAELAGDKQMLNESIALLRKTKEQEVKKVSGTYENLLEKMDNEIKQGQIAITELKGKLTVDVVDKILFDSGKAEIKPEGLEVLGRVVDILTAETDKVIRVEGHTDNVPIKGNLAKQYPTNWELSAARALTVVRYLETQGLDPHKLAAVAFGEHRPVAENDTPEGRARNRRIAIVLQPEE
ncbi:MAG: OmpA family protein [Syntrophales bacterium]|jgi:chemotaxis protein MotB|nr:OmpA family protein [Syntrophales bacterium]